MEKQKHIRFLIPGFFFVVFFLFPGMEKLYARERASGNTDSVLWVCHRADSLNRLRRWQAALPLYQEAEKRYLRHNKIKEAWRCRYSRVMAFISLQAYDSAERSMQEARLVYQPYINQNHRQSDLTFLQGFFAYKTKNYEQAILFFHKIPEAKGNKSFLESAHRYLAYTYFQLGDFFKARDQMLQVLSLEKNKTDPYAIASNQHWLSILYTYYLADRAKGLHYLTLAREQYQQAKAGPGLFSKIYNELGTIYMENGDYTQARDYYMMAINTLPSDKLHLPVLANVYNNLGIINQKTGRYPQAETYFLKSLSLKHRIGMKDVYRTYSNMGNLFMAMEKKEKANTYYRKALENITFQYGKSNWRLANTYQNLGLLFIEEDHLQEGRQYLEEALQIYRDQYGARHPKTARCYLKFELYFWKKDQPDSALFYIQKALIANSPDFNSPDYFKNPSPDQVFSKEVLLMTLKDKARAFKKLYDRNQEIRYLKEALHTQQKAINLIRIIRRFFRNPQSKMLLAAHEEDTYQQAFLLSVKLYQVTGNKQFLHRAFTFSEESRASGLLSAIRTNRAINYAGIPDSVIKTENEITRETGAYEELLYKERNKVSPDARKTKKYEKKIFRLQAQKDSLIRMMEKSFPKYYQLKYDLSTIPAETAMHRLKKNQAILEYEIIDNSIYIFCLTNKQIQLIIQEADPSLDEYIAVLWKELQQKQFNKNASANYYDLIYSSYSLFQNLIQPVDSLIRNKHLIIVPDDKIAEIPFDALISEIPHVKLTSYRKLPYLIYQHPITRSYSSTLYFENQSRRRKFFNRVIAFAPDYPQSGLDLHQIMQVRQGNYRLYPLPYAREEAKEVCHYTFGRLILGKQANEHFFKTHTSHYDIIHLAMHTIMNNQHPLYSKLVFTQPPDSLDDGYLNAYEIYALQFKTNLVVLSACNSGSGKLSKGEGIISLARSFMYAGASRLIMSLWEVQDRTGAIIMTLFYKNLVSGMPVDVSLQKAKITYLEQADPLKSSPYFWAGYQVMGNASPVYFPIYLSIAILIILSGGIVWAIIRIKKNHSSRL